jgi:hypothetical protein
MTLLKKLAIAISIGAGIIVMGFYQVALGSVLQGFQGGTGFGPSASSTCLNKYLQFSSTTPYVTYQCASAGGGSGSGTVTTSTAFTPTYIPIINGATSIGNSSLSEPGGGVTLKNGIPILDGGGDFIGPNVFPSGNSIIAQNVTGTAVLGYTVMGGNIFNLTTSTVLNSAQFCSGSTFDITGTSGNINFTIPSTTAIGGFPCNSQLYSGQTTLEFVDNNSTNTINLQVTGANEEQLFIAGAQAKILPGQEDFSIGHWVATSTIQGATTTGQTFIVDYFTLETSTPLVCETNNCTVLGSFAVGTSTTNSPYPATVFGTTDEFGNGPLYLSDNATTTNGGVSITMDSTLQTGGHAYSFTSTGLSDSSGAGYFTLLDDTADAYRMSISPSGNFTFGGLPGTNIALYTSYGGAYEIPAGDLFDSVSNAMAFTTENPSKPIVMTYYSPSLGFNSAIDINGSSSGYGNVKLMKSGGNVGIGIGASFPATTLQVSGASSTVRIGSGGTLPGCIEMYDKTNSATLDYMYFDHTAMVVTTTQPNFCE